jgi:mono/diheme cytochrome c family protein
MRTALAIVSVLILAGSALAEPFPKADPKAGGKLFADAKCMACHAQRFGGDGSGIFTRPERKVKSADALLKQIRACVTQLNVQWFPDEEEHVAAYLNQRYYKFP